MHLTVIKGAEVYSPTYKGKCDVAFAQDNILSIGEIEVPETSGLPLKIIDGENKLVIPGFVDPLVHINGGGGEGGFHTRTPQMPVTDAIRGGVTTLVSALGTDAVTRSLEDMLARLKTFSYYGLSTYAYTGNYHLPITTITGDVKKDIILIEEFIGVGEVAVADHRGSQIDKEDLATLAAHARVAGMLSGKAGIVFVHVGDGKDKLEALKHACSLKEVSPTQFYPTHINRNASLLDAGIEWAKHGGFIDFTASTNEAFVDDDEIPANEAVVQAIEAGVDTSHISISSDGNASLPVFDQDGQLKGLEIGSVSSVFRCFQKLINKHHLSIEDATRAVSTTAATALKLPKGKINVGQHADLLVLDKHTLALEHVFAKGQHLLKDGEINVDIMFE